MITIGWSAAGLIHYSPLNPGKTCTSEKYPQQIDENTPKTAMPATSISQQKGPSSSPQQHLTTYHTTNASKIELVYEVLPQLPYSRDLTSTNDHFFKHLDNFLQGKCFHNHQEAINAF